MYRDDLILQGIAAGASTTATLAEKTGISTASVGRGLCRLIQSGHVFSPARGVYRLTDSGAALLVLPDGVPAAPEQSAEAVHDQPLAGVQSIITPGNGQTGPDRHHDAMEHDHAAVAPASVAITGRFGCGAIAFGGVVLVLGGLVLGRFWLTLLAARQDAPPPSGPPAEPVQSGAYVPPWSNWG